MLQLQLTVTFLVLFWGKNRNKLGCLHGWAVVPANVKSSWQSCLVQSRKSHKQEKVNQNILGISDESLRSTGSHVGCASPGPPPPPPGLQCAGFCFVGLHLLQETIVHCAGLKSPVMPPKCFLFILSLDMKEGGLRVPATNSPHFALSAFLFMVLWHLHPPNKDVKGYTLTCWVAMSCVSYSLLQWYWSSDLEWLVVALVLALIAPIKAISRSYYIYIVLTAPTPRDHHAKLKCSYNATIMFLYNFESWSEEGLLSNWTTF